MLLMNSAFGFVFPKPLNQGAAVYPAESISSHGWPQKPKAQLFYYHHPHSIAFYGPSQCRQEHKEEGQGLVQAATVLMNVALPRDAAHVLVVVTVLWRLPLSYNTLVPPSPLS